MNGSWATTWDIAAKRHMTKMGNGHLSEHAHEILQAFVVQEAQDQMAQMMGGFWAKQLMQ